MGDQGRLGIEVIRVGGEGSGSGHVDHDWVDIVPLGPARCAVVVGGCAHHADPAGLARFRAGLHAVAGLDLPASLVVDRMDAFTAECGLGGPVSLSYTVIDAVRRTMTSANAGAPPPVLIDAGAARSPSDEVAAPLGIGAHVPSHRECVLPQGSVLVLPTAGVLAADAGSSRLQDIADRVVDRPSPALADLARELDRVLRGTPDAAAALVRVVGDPRLASQWCLPAVTRSAAVARRSVDAAAAQWPVVDADARHDLSLVVTELVANAVEQAASGVRLLVALTPSGVLVEARDPSPGMPRRTRVPPTQVDGRGMALVSAISQRWGSRWEDDAKVVWAEVAWAGAPRESAAATEVLAGA